MFVRRFTLKSPTITLTSLISFLIFATVSKPVFAVDKATCAAAHSKSQELRTEGKLRATRDQLTICTDEGCPRLVREDCGRWTGEVQQEIPTVVLSARDAAGRDMVAVNVSLDGEALTDKLDGKPVIVDPGERTFRFEAQGIPAVESKVVIKVGEKNRSVAISFGGDAIASSQTGIGGPKVSPAGSSNGDTTEVDRGHSKVGALPYVFLGVGVVALGAFAYFGISGKSKLSDLKSTCAPYCDSSERDAVHTKLVIADVSLGVGIVSLGIATYAFIAAPSSAASATSKSRTTHVARFDVRPLDGGAFATFATGF